MDSNTTNAELTELVLHLLTEKQELRERVNWLLDHLIYIAHKTDYDLLNDPQYETFTIPRNEDGSIIVN